MGVLRWCHAVKMSKGEVRKQASQSSNDRTSWFSLWDPTKYLRIWDISLNHQGENAVWFSHFKPPLKQCNIAVLLKDDMVLSIPLAMNAEITYYKTGLNRGLTFSITWKYNSVVTVPLPSPNMQCAEKGVTGSWGWESMFAQSSQRHFNHHEQTKVAFWLED